MKDNEYKCAMCSGIFEKGWTDEEAMEECNDNFGEIGGTGANTYLGNFAFNSTAVGDPNNTNYRIGGGSDITRKFVTASQSGSFVDRPKYWHNINMLP